MRIDYSDQSWTEDDSAWWREQRLRDVAVITIAEFVGCVLAFLWWLVVT